jgi:hypothetical protein
MQQPMRMIEISVVSRMIIAMLGHGWDLPSLVHFYSWPSKSSGTNIKIANLETLPRKKWIMNFNSRIIKVNYKVNSSTINLMIDH